MTIDELAPAILPVVLSNVTTHYPYHDSHLSTINDKPRDPAVAHPSFGNSYDWHSSVHSHWTAVQLIEHFTSHPFDGTEMLAQLVSVVFEHLSAKPIDVEIAYLRHHRTYERPYGWAWAMMLAAALDAATHAPTRRCAHALDAMARWIAESAIAWMTVLPEPVRHGVHSNTAFALGLMHDAARDLELDALQHTIEQRARTFFAQDRGWPQAWERSAHDFLSPGLAEADLMRRIMARDEFARWWAAFLPELEPRAKILEPVAVPDVADGQIVHLHGLNLSRSGALARIAVAVEDGELLDSAIRLYRVSVYAITKGDYLVTHWLPTFAWDAAKAIDQASACFR